MGRIYGIPEEIIINIANAIRNKNGEHERYYIENFANKINQLKGKALPIINIDNGERQATYMQLPNQNIQEDFILTHINIVNPTIVIKNISKEE